MGGWESAKPGFIILICGILGTIISIIEQLAYDNGYLLDSYVTGSDMLVGLQVLTIIIFLLAGGVLAAISQ